LSNTSSTPARSSPPGTLPANYRYNLLLLIGDTVFFGLLMAFINNQSVLPDFVGRLTQSEVLVGLIGVLMPLGWMVPQLVVAPRVARSVRKKPWVVLPSMPGRSALFIVAAGIALLGVDNPLPVLVVLFLGYATFAVCDGVSSVGWMDILGLALPDERRGRMFGIGRALSGVIVLFGVSQVVRYILDPQTGPSFPNDYALLFWLAGVCGLISLVLFASLRETWRLPAEAAAPAPRRVFFAYLGRIVRQDVRFRDFLMARVAYDLGNIAAPFYVRFATESLHIASEDAVSGALQLSTLSSIVFGLLMGWLSERRGSRVVILLACLGLLGQPILALVAGAGPTWVIFLAFAMSGVAFSAFGPGHLNWIIEHAGDERRAIYFSLSSAFSIIGVMSPILGGVIADRASYETLFLVALTLALIGLGLALRLAEPRVESARTRVLEHKLTPHG
jgi:MFS family permease